MKVKLLSLIGMAFLLSSCTYEVFEADSNDLSRITCVADNFIFENAVQTRSAADLSNTENIAFQWSENDVVGIFPNKGTQISFPMTDGAGASSATFDGGGWALKNEATYYAYYPYNWEYCESEDFKNKIPYTYIGQKAVYEDQNGVVNLGAYDYMCTSASTPASGSVNFAFHHVGALARMEITFPVTATYTKLVITASEAIFPVTGTFDLIADTFSLNSSSLASSIEIDLENLAGTQDEKKLVYFMLPPADCSKLKSFTSTLITSDATEYYEEIEKKNLESGKAYNWGLIISDKQEPGTLVDGVAKLAEAGTLATVLGDQMLTLTSLKVVGEINGSDALCLRQMLGGYEFESSQIGKLNTLDLTDASIVKGWFAFSQVQENEIMDFYKCGGLKSLLLPNSLVSIGANAFAECSSLTSIIIPDNVTRIGSGAFAQCTSLTSVTIGDRVTIIDFVAFSGCTSLTNVIIGNNVTTIDTGAFSSCSSLTSITLPDSVTEIGSQAFQNCTSLTSITIPNSVTSISGEAFKDCTSLTNVTLPNNITRMENVFTGCTSLTNITVPNSVTVIVNTAFKGCSSLSSVTIGSGVTLIGSNIFDGCENLSEVICLAVTPPDIYEDTFTAINTLKVPKGTKELYELSDWKNYFTNIVESDDERDLGTLVNGVATLKEAGALVAILGDQMLTLTSLKIVGEINGTDVNCLRQMLGGCEFESSQKGKLNSLDLTDASIVEGGKHYIDINNVGSYYIKSNTIGNRMFYRCDGLQSIQLPKTVTKIAEYAFYRCESLTSVMIYNSVTEINHDAFFSCSSLVSINIPDSVTSIVYNTFHSCAFTSIDIPSSVTYIDYLAFLYCDKLAEINVDSENSQYTSIDGVVYDKESATLIRCPDAKGSITIPQSVTVIGSYALHNCTSLTNVNIPNSVTTIRGYAFYNCLNVTSITIPENVTSIGSAAFNSCTSLSEIKCTSSTPPSIERNTFSSIDSNAKFYVPQESVEAYKTATNWSTYANVIYGIE